MIRNYFKIAVRSLYRNPAFSFINIAGLVIGLVSSILIGLWVANEITWDDLHEKKDRLYRVYLNGQADNGISTQMAIPLPLWEEFKTNEPDIEFVAPTSWGWNMLLGTGDKKFNKFTYYAGDDFLRMFSFPLVKGSQENQLKDPFTIVITESAARDLFGTEEPLGKAVRFSNMADLIVTGVVKDPPQNSSFRFDCLIPFSYYILQDNWVKRSLTNWNNNSFNLYVAFREGADPAAIEQRVKNVIKKHSTEETSLEVTFLPMERWHLYSEFENGKSVSGNIVYVRTFSLIGIFILIIACINFTNLATARSEQRAKEVGIRKSVGSRRKELITQFLGETILLAFIAFSLAIALAEAVLPYFNTLIGKQLAIQYNQPMVWMTAVIIILTTGILAGSYPAFYLSSFKAVSVLKGKVNEGRKGSMPRKVMVTLQFLFSIVLIISTLVIYQQIQYLKNRPVGYDKDHLLMVWASGDIQRNYQVVKRELKDQRLCSEVSVSSSPITDIYSYVDDVVWPGKREDQRNNIAVLTTGSGYSKTTGMKILQGRDFSGNTGDSSAVILNRAAAEYMELKDPIGEIIRQDDEAYTVVAVAENLVMTSPYQQAEPTVFFYNEKVFNEMMIRLPSERSDLREVISGIEKIFKKYNPDYPFGYRFADQEYNQKFSSIELIGKLSNLFAGLAIFISCLGLLGLAAFTAERRTKEIGIRKVLGASVTSIVTLLSKEFTILVVIAFSIAAPVTLWQADRILAQYPYHVTIPWWILPLTGALAVTLTIVTVSTQAIRAAMSNPVKSLRNE